MVDNEFPLTPENIDKLAADFDEVRQTFMPMMTAIKPMVKVLLDMGGEEAAVKSILGALAQQPPALLAVSVAAMILDEVKKEQQA